MKSAKEYWGMVELVQLKMSVVYQRGLHWMTETHRLLRQFEALTY
jgi:hypothetical protein